MLKPRRFKLKKTYNRSFSGMHCGFGIPYPVRPELNPSFRTFKLEAKRVLMNRFLP